MYFDRFDICEAYWLVYCNWLNRDIYQWSIKLHRIGFKPNRMLSYESLSDNGKAIHDALEAKMIEKHYTSKGIVYKND